MGNKSSPAHQMPSKAFEFEYINGKCLLQGIRNNNPAEVAAAIDKARKEFTKPVGISLQHDYSLNYLLEYYLIRWATSQ